MNSNENIPFLSPEGTPSPEKIVPCQPVPRPILPTLPSDDYESHDGFPGWSSQPSEKNTGNSQRYSPWKAPYFAGESDRLEKNENFGDSKSNENLKRELQSSEAEITALRLALNAATEEIR